MRIVIPSYNRAEAIRTHKLLTGLDYYIFVNNQEQFDAYSANKTIESGRIINMNLPKKGIAEARQWIQDNFIQKDEWYISLDDNINYFLGVPEPHYSEEFIDTKKDKSLKPLFEKNKISGERFVEICEEMRVLGESKRAYNIGFSTTPNYFFRPQKIRYVGYVISKAVVRKNVGIPFVREDGEYTEAMEEFGYNAECLLRYGKVIINNYVFASAGHYQKGGIGTYEERVDRKVKDCELLMKQYPFLFGFKIKKGCHPKGELAIRFTSLEQVEKWRFYMNKIK